MRRMPGGQGAAVSRVLPGFCNHDRFRYFSLKRGSQDGIVCVTCRAFWHRERKPFGGTALVRRHISVLGKGLRHDRIKVPE